MDMPDGAGLTVTRAAGPTARIFVSDQNSEGVIRQSLNDLGINDAQFTKGNVETATAILATQVSPRLLIVDVSDVKDPVGRMDELAEKCEPDIGVIVIGDRNDIILYRDMKSAGVFEYFFKPLVRDLVKRTCSNILSGENARSTSLRTGKLIFVLGMRGGVGATTIATNAAWYLSEVRQRWVMLVDLDLQSGDAALQLDVAPTHALREALDKPDRVDKLFLERGAIHATERLDLLASLEPPGEFVTPLNETAVFSLVEKLIRRYRFIFVDLPVSVAVGLMPVLQQPSTCMLVSNASLASAREVVRWRECIGPNTSERKTLHILNMNGAYGGLPEAEFTRAVGVPPDIIIAYDREIAIASVLGVKATQTCKTLNRSLAKLLRDVSGESETVTPSLFRRMFR